MCNSNVASPYIKGGIIVTSAENPHTYSPTVHHLRGSGAEAFSIPESKRLIKVLHLYD